MPGKKQENLIENVLDMKNQGMSDTEIASSLSRKYSNDEIAEAINQANIKNTISDEEIPLELRYAPSPSNSSNSSEQTTNFSSNSFSQAPSFSQPSTVPQFQPRTTFPTTTSFRDSSSFENVEEIAEAIIKEKWDDLTKDIGDLRLWKERIDTDLAGVKQELIRTQYRFENLQRALIGKVSDYDSTMRDVSSEMKALSQVFEKIIGPLTKNVKDLSEIADKMHHRKK